MLVNVLTRYPAPPPAALEPAVVENPNGFGAHLIGVATPVADRLLIPVAVQNAQAFGNHAVGFAPTLVAQARVENAHAFGAPDIQNLAFGIRHLFATTVVPASEFGAPTIAARPSATVSAILPSDLDTIFVAGDGTARSAMAGATFVNLDG